MKDQRPDGFMMIGLHKLAAQNGDGLVPELYDLLVKHAERQQLHANVTEFPVWEARMPGEKTDAALGREAANGNNVVFFPQARVDGTKV
ncbi:hypothetical protein EV128_1327 [Rhizobium azibense]|nr:hypothetical protein EV128_1327 [Rhizobium azibense]